MMTVHDILNELRATSSRNAKEALLKQHVDDELLKEAFRLALDPLTQFYQRKIPEYKPKTKSQLNLQDAFVALGELSSRKVTGNAAIDYLRKLLESVNSSDARVIERIIQKDPDCGVQASTVNKVWKDLVHEYPCMLASGYDEKLVDKINFPAFVQTKLDGMRFNAIVDVKANNVEYRSRNGKEVFVNNPLLDAAFIKMAMNIGMSGVVFDGELLVVDASGKYLDRKTGNGILNKAVKGTIKPEEVLQVRAVLWDMIPTQYFRAGRCDVDYETRLGTLDTAVDNLGENLKYLVSVVKTKLVDTLYQARREFEKLYAAGEEGIILKDISAPWEDKRAKHQIKFKGELECDLICVGWEEGTGKNKGKLGALVLTSSDASVNVSVGTGLTDSIRASLKPQDVLNKVVAIKYNARIKSKDREADSLFLPVFVEIREDKTEADASKDIK